MWEGLFASEVDFTNLLSELRSRLDKQQRDVLLSMSQEHRRVVCWQASAGTGKTHMGTCLLHQMLRSNKLDDGFIIWAVRMRTLRDDILGR